METTGDDFADQEIECVGPTLVVGPNDDVGLRLIKGRKIAHG